MWVYILILLLLYYSTYSRFTKSNDISEFILKDKDNYVSKLSDEDLKSRGCSTHKEYTKQYYDGISSFTFIESMYISKYIIQADRFLSTIKSEFVDSRILSIPWKILKSNSTVEMGYHHTRGAFIVLQENLLNNSSDYIVTLLIHEKIHIYQRLYEKSFKKALLDNNYQHIGIKTRDYPMNPDTDSIIYKHPNGRIMKYKKDTKWDDRLYEHPNEHIAYTISRKYNTLKI